MIEDINEDATGIVQAKISWAYHKNDLPPQHRQKCSLRDNEILFSDDRQHIFLECIDDFAKVNEFLDPCSDLNNWCWNKEYYKDTGEIIVVA